MLCVIGGLESRMQMQLASSCCLECGRRGPPERGAAGNPRSFVQWISQPRPSKYLPAWRHCRENL